LTGSPDERLTLCIFVCSGGFTDEAKLGTWASNTKDRLLTASGQFRTTRTTRNFTS
jgi:hypothetical protein